MTAAHALYQDDSDASYDEQAAVEMTFGTRDRQGVVRVRHGGRGLILMQSFGVSNREGETV
jgi:hypothetical protein